MKENRNENGTEKRKVMIKSKSTGANSLFLI